MQEEARDIEKKELTPVCQHIISFIRTGSENAIHAYDLVIISGTSDRAVRKAVSDARDNGEVILSNNSGYFRPSLPKDEELVRKYIAAQEKRARHSFRSVKSAKKLLGEIETDKAVEEMKDVLENMTHGAQQGKQVEKYSF